jgi:non-canonical (house-cleaning) NTP pyrophosphatase
VAILVREGMELGDADDIVFAKSNSKQQNGAVGLLTNDVITRKSLYLPAVQMAFIPFLNPELYS